MNIFLIMVLAIVVHEIGHYLLYLAVGIKPSIRFTWFGIVLGEKQYYRLLPVEAYLVNLAGIMAGLIVIFAFQVEPYYQVVYFLMCCVDITNIIQVISLPKTQKKMNLLQISRLQIKELEEQAKREGFE